MAEKKFEFESMRKIKLEDMMSYIEAKAPTDKAWFKTVAFQNKDGVTQKSYQHLNAVKQFCLRYEEFRSLVPKSAKEPNKSEKLMNW